jgi:hypothetical protein
MVQQTASVELISEGFGHGDPDCELEDSTLRARKLTETSRRMVASRVFHNTAATKIDDLNDHKLHYSNQSNSAVWKLKAPQVKNAAHRWLVDSHDGSPC